MVASRLSQILVGVIASVILVVSFAIETRAASMPGAALHIGGADIEVSFEAGALNLPRASVLDWISKSACAVTEYYGHFAVRHLNVDIVPLENGKGVVFGRTFIPDRTAKIRIILGRSATETDLREDWVMTHEMVHLAFPQVPRKHHWIEEGIATYVEPIARAQIGDLRAEKVWRDLVDGLPHGLPAPGDEGLDNTHTWGRTYWGGALFCMMADVEIHRRTKNKFALQDALRAIAKTTNFEVESPLARALKIGDDAIGVPVLIELYDRMKDTPTDPNLAKLWQGLGIKVSGDSVAFDKSAPLASTVSSIMMPRAEKTICRAGQK
jgi:hypothetical protein